MNLYNNSYATEFRNNGYNYFCIAFFIVIDESQLILINT